MREKNEIINNNLKKSRIYDDETLENMKRYYNINDHTELLKFIYYYFLFKVKDKREINVKKIILESIFIL